MSVTKDGDTGRWMSQIRVTDWTGKTIHKKKRGFATKKEALQWERDFISQSTGSLGMTFGDFISLYVKDMEHRLKPSTVASKKWLIDLKVTPFFKKIPLNEIKPTHVRQWQNSLTSYRDENGKPYAQTYLKCINNQLTAIFNYAVKYYGLKENPCHKAGSMGKKHADEMLFWTKQEFQTFIEVMKDRPASYAVFMTLYFTGIREGELLALTPSDIDFEKKTLTVNKSYQRLGREDIITTPKTPKSNRTLPIPDGLCTCLQEYMSHCYGLQKDDRLFPYTKSYFTYDAASGQYLKNIHGAAQVDGMNGEQLTFSNVIIQNTNWSKRDAKGYLAFQTIDSTSDGYYFTKGRGIHITWKKTSDYSPTKYYDDNGNEIQLNEGKTYIAIAQKDRTLLYS